MKTKQYYYPDRRGFIKMSVVLSDKDANIIRKFYNKFRIDA
jgi:hypothetical protein